MSKRTVLSVLGLAMTFSLSSVGAGSDPSMKVVYGKDDRQDLFEVTDPLVREQVNSTATFSIRGLINPLPNGDFSLNEGTLGVQMNLCPGTRYAEQQVVGACSATLVSPRHLLTAGHCMPDQNRCDEIYLIFGFHLKSAGDVVRTVPKRDVYRCKKLVVRTQSDYQDFALIELDRDVVDRKPVTISGSQEVKKGDTVRMVGYPDGIPSKVVAGAPVRSSSKRFFVAALDAFKGNSGSGVFSEKTGDLVGVLFRGDLDYFYDNARGCRIVNTNAQNTGRGEDVTQVSGVWKELKPYLAP